MRILVFGSTGMLGHKLIQRLSKSAEVWGTIRNNSEQLAHFDLLPSTRVISQVDSMNEASVRSALATARPDIVINAVGIVKQLPTSKDVILTLQVNSIFPHLLSQLGEEYGYRLITISTDCVFDGVKGNYSENDKPNADDLYGKSKHLGEVIADRALTLRTSIIGREIGTAHSLVEWFLSNEGGAVRGYTNAIYSGFPTIVLADIIKDLIFKFPELHGLYHVSSEPIDKYSLLSLLKENFGLNIKVEPFEDFRIDRSLDSSKFRSITGFAPQPWEQMLRTMAADPTPYGK